MSKYELSIAKDYVPTWTCVDAVRELFQNALDQQVVMENNEMFFDYAVDSQTLRIGNKLSVLDTSTLLLGASTKRDDTKTIGQFGEGYKIATLVLTRLGKTVVFYNYGAKEVWKPRFVNSRRYGTQVLTFFIDKKYPWQSVPHHNLIIEVSNVTTEEYQEIVASNLHLMELTEYFETKKGRILLEEKYKGKVYVNGLFICDYKPYHYGYDFKPAFVKIDRDRKLVNSFDLKWLASQMWLDQTSSEMTEIAAQLAITNAEDVAYINDVYASHSSYQDTADVVLNKFVEEHGEKAVPVSTQKELESVSIGYHPVMVTSSYQKIVTSSSYYNPPPKIHKLSSKERLEKWLGYHKKSLSSGAIRELKSIIDEL